MSQIIITIESDKIATGKATLTFDDNNIKINRGLLFEVSNSIIEIINSRLEN